jgi:hypothetical protein
VFFRECHADSSGISLAHPKRNPSRWDLNRNSVKNVIERNLAALLIAVLAGFDHLLGFAQGSRVDTYNHLFFRRRIEEIGRRSVT